MTDIPPNERAAAGQAQADEPAVRGEVIPPYSEHPHHATDKPADWRKHHDRRDPLSGVFWAAMLILAGAIFLADNMGYLPNYHNADAWAWIMLGAGGLLLVEALIRSITPEFHGPGVFTVILGFVLLAFGAGEVFGLRLDQWWPVILIVLGLSALMRGFRR